MKFIKNGQLNDTLVLAAIKTALDDFENGAIMEARDTLADIVNAIDEWSKEN